MNTFDTPYHPLREPFADDEHTHTLDPLDPASLPFEPTSTSHSTSTLTYPTSSERLNSPQTVTIFSRPPSIEQESHVDDEAPSSYHTADNSQSPVLIHPTVRCPDTLHPLVGILRRTQSVPVTDYCTICARTGHSLVNCILRGPIVCSYCREVGHTRGVCNRLRMDIVSYHPRLQYCDICETLSGVLTGYLRSNPSHAPIIRIVRRYPSRLSSYILAKSGILGEY